jgi:hypothetical protein
MKSRNVPVVYKISNSRTAWIKERFSENENILYIQPTMLHDAADREIEVRGDGRTGFGADPNTNRFPTNYLVENKESFKTSSS